MHISSIKLAALAIFHPRSVSAPHFIHRAFQLWFYFIHRAFQLWLYCVHRALQLWLCFFHRTSRLWLYFIHVACQLWLYFIHRALQLWLYLIHRACQLWLYCIHSAFQIAQAIFRTYSVLVLAMFVSARRRGPTTNRCCWRGDRKSHSPNHEEEDQWRSTMCPKCERNRMRPQCECGH